MRLTRNDLSGQDIPTTGVDCREIVLISLTPSELMNSITERLVPVRSSPVLDLYLLDSSVTDERPLPLENHPPVGRSTDAE